MIADREGEAVPLQSIMCLCGLSYQRNQRDCEADERLSERMRVY
jgi:hypothetical protein